MHHTIARMIDKPEDYVLCSGCGCWNWYEHKSCVNCDLTLEGCRRTNVHDAKKLEESFKQYNLDSVELDV